MFFAGNAHRSDRPSKWIVSGVPPSRGGVGRLLARLLPLAQKQGYRILCRREAVSIARLCRTRQFGLAAMEPLLRSWDTLRFSLRLRSLHGSTIIFIYPQLAGFDHLFRLLKHNDVFLYVMDNSFFCIRSYNTDPADDTECLRCVQNPDAARPQCTSFPRAMPKSKNTAMLHALRARAAELHFLVQNKLQSDLVKSHFGSACDVQIVGMDTGELTFQPVANGGPGRHAGYDLVFHGINTRAKGIKYFIDLAQQLHEFRHLVPIERSAVERELGTAIAGNHIDFIPMTWETGLEDAVIGAGLVVHPSMWSAPIEGALLKSLDRNGNVAATGSRYGFARELIEQHIVLGLPMDVLEAAASVRAHFASRVDRAPQARQWLRDFTAGNDIEHVLSAVAAPAPAKGENRPTCASGRTQ